MLGGERDGGAVDHIRQRRRRRGLFRIFRRARGHADGGIAQPFGDLPAHLFHALTGEHAAVHIGLGALRQGVAGVAGVQHGGDAGGAQRAMPARILRHDGLGSRVSRIGQQGAVGGCGRRIAQLGHLGEIGARRV